MTDPTRTAYVHLHLEELRSEAEHERLAALGHAGHRDCPWRVRFARLRDRDRCPVLRGVAAVRSSGLAGGRR